MNTYLEDLIRDAQRRQADRALPPERILAGLRASGAAPRPRVRGRGAPLVAAACAVVLAVAAVPVAVDLATAERGAGSPGWSGSVPDFGALPSPREVWPEAVHRIPERLPDGSDYTVAAVLGGGRYLVRLSHPWPFVYDAGAGTVRPLGGPERDGVLGEVFVDGGRVYWSVERPSRPNQLWTAPLDGGASHEVHVGRSPDGTVYPIGARDAVVYWRVATAEGGSAIYRLPVGAGQMARVAGADGYEDFGQFPWVRSAGGHLLDVVTGERREWTPDPSAAAMDCNPMVCFVVTGDGRAVVRRLDGGDAKALSHGQSGLPFEVTAREGRIGIGSFTRQGGETWIWDRVTGRAAAVDRLYLRDNGRVPGTVVQWTEREGERYVLDLAAIS